MNFISCPITLCMIVKNEEKNLARCLKSVQNIASDIIIVDTGSTDKTVDIAKTFGAKVYSFKWKNDFAAARNFSLSKAKTNWIFYLDADEELVVHDQKTITDILADQKNPGYLIPIWNYTGEKHCPTTEISLSLRFFKKNYRFKGSIHEQIFIPPTQEPKLLEAGIVIKHYGYLNQETQEKAKTSRNIALLGKELEENSKNPFTLFYMGNEYLRLDRYDLAIGYYSQALPKIDPKIVTFYSQLIKQSIFCLMELGRYNEGLQLISEGLKHHPNYTDLYYLKGQIAHLQQNYPEAVKAFSKCLNLGETPLYLTSTLGVGSFKALYSLGLIKEEVQDFDEAEKFYFQAIQSHPDFYYPFYNLINLTLKRKPKNLRTFIKKHFDLNNEKTAQAVIDILKDFHQYSITSELLENLSTSMPKDSSLKYKLGLSYFYLKKPQKALRELKEIPADNIYYLPSVKFKFLCHFLLNQHLKASQVLQVLNQDPKYIATKTLLTDFHHLLIATPLKPQRNQPELIQTDDLIKAGLSLLKDFLLIKDFAKTKLVEQYLRNLRPYPYLDIDLAQLYFNFKANEESFKLILKCLQQNNLDRNLLLMLKELFKEDSKYLAAFETFVENTDSQLTYLLKAKLLQGKAINLLNQGLKNCPASEVISSKLELYEENFLKI